MHVQHFACEGHVEKMINYNRVSKKKFISNNPHLRKFLIVVQRSLSYQKETFCWFIGHNNDILWWYDLSDIQRKWEYEKCSQAGGKRNEQQINHKIYVLSIIKFYNDFKWFLFLSPFTFVLAINFDKYFEFEMDYIIPFPNMRIYPNDMNEGIQDSC